MTGCVHTPFCLDLQIASRVIFYYLSGVFFWFFLGSIYVRRERPAGDAELMEELADGQTDGGDQ